MQVAKIRTAKRILQYLFFINGNDYGVYLCAHMLMSVVQYC